jgi:hypothetical protein
MTKNRQEEPIALSVESGQSVSAFFGSYRTAFERLDAPAIAGHFAYPSQITSDGGGPIIVTSIVTKQDWTRHIEQLLGMYRKIGFSSARILDMATTIISERLVQVFVRWSLLDRGGRSLYDFEAAYTLANMNGNLRITAISHNETLKSRAYMVSLEQ